MEPPSLRLSYICVPARLMQLRVLVSRTRESKQMEPNAMSQAELFPLTLHDQIIPEITQIDRSGIICDITARPAPPARASAYMWPRSKTSSRIHRNTIRLQFVWGFGGGGRRSPRPSPCSPRRHQDRSPLFDHAESPTQNRTLIEFHQGGGVRVCCKTVTAFVCNCFNIPVPPLLLKRCPNREIFLCRCKHVSVATPLSRAALSAQPLAAATSRHAVRERLDRGPRPKQAQQAGSVVAPRSKQAEEARPSRGHASDATAASQLQRWLIAATPAREQTAPSQKQMQQQ